MQLEHANITVKSLDETLRFLGVAFPGAQIRGGGSLHGDESLGRWVHFGEPDSYIAIQENTNHQAARDVTYSHDGINHLGFVVDELDALMARMDAAGYVLSPASALDSHPHRRRAYFFDGNGTEWEFVEYLSDRLEERNDYTL